MTRFEGAVALLSPGWPAGTVPNGILTYVASLRDGLTGLGVESYVLCPHARETSDKVVELPDPALWRRSPRAIRWLRYRLAPEREHARAMAAVLVQTVNRLAAERNVRILEMEESFGWAHWVVPHVSVPVVVRLHGPWFLNGAALGVPFAERDRMEKLGVAAATRVSAPSRDVLRRGQEHWNLPLLNAAVIPYPQPVCAPDAEWRFEACDQNRLLFVGRFDRHKGGGVLIDAFRLVLQEQPQARLTFVGPDRGLEVDGQRWSLLSYAQQRLGSQAHALEWLGLKTCPREIQQLRQSSLMTIVCSTYENFAYAALEALSQGAPCIVSDVGGLVEMVEHERNGLVFKAGDATALAQTILRLLREPSCAMRLGRQARLDVAARYDPQAIASRTLDFYSSVLEPRPSV